MADFGDLGGETGDGAGQGRQAAGQDVAIRSGLLSPSGFPSIFQAGSLADGDAGDRVDDRRLGGGQSVDAGCDFGSGKRR